MAESIVINTGPIISLGKMGILVLVEQLPFEFYTTAQVRTEVIAGIHAGHSIEMPDWIGIRSLTRRPDVHLFSTLDTGEASVIQFAEELSVRTVCIDEIKGRRVAAERGLRCIGSLGILGRLSALELLDDLDEVLRRIRTGGVYYSETLLDSFIRDLKSKRRGP
jgi:predicted nucleic acid-binding protein